MLLVDKFSSTGIWSTDYCRKIFVDTTLRRHSTSSTSILSKFFRRHDISSTQHFVDKHFVDTTLRRHNISSTNISSTNISSTNISSTNISSIRHFVEFFLSTQTCKSRIVVKSFKLLKISNYSAFKSWE
jgi:hypothetical protein